MELQKFSFSIAMFLKKFGGSRIVLAFVFTPKHNLFPLLSRGSSRLRFPYPLDDCECGHYRLNHISRTNPGETKCNACSCSQFSLKQSANQQLDVKTQD